ncbi:18283_t:CDS:2, partial [Dentiscutata erythropus]
MDYFNKTDPKCWSLLGYLQWRSDLADFASKTYEHSVFIDIIRKKSLYQVGAEGEAARLILGDWQDIKNSPEVSAFWNNYNNTDVQRKRKLWQIESSDLEYVYKRDQQLGEEIKLIRDKRIKAQYNGLTQSQFVETNASIMNLSSIINNPEESYSTIVPNINISSSINNPEESYSTIVPNMNLSSILNDPEESYSTITPNDDGFKTPPQKPCKTTITTPQKPILYDKTMQYLVNHFSINVNKQCVIMKADNVDAFPKEIRSWLIDSEKNAFESAIMTPPNPDHPFRKVCKSILYDFFSMTIEGPLIRYIGERKYTVDRIVPLFKAIQSVYREYTFDWIEVQANCIKDARMLFPEFDLKLNKVDGIGFKVSSNKEVVFIEVSGGPENAILKHVREDTEKLIKEGMFGLVALLRDFLDKNAECAKNICTYMFTIGDRITLSELRLDGRHYYKISQIKSAILPFSFEEVEKFIEVFELLYALVNGLKNQTNGLKKLMLADSNSNEPTIRDWKYSFNMG